MSLASTFPLTKGRSGRYFDRWVLMCGEDSVQKRMEQAAVMIRVKSMPMILADSGSGLLYSRDSRRMAMETVAASEPAPV